jgi:CBS domain-containing protein
VALEVVLTMDIRDIATQTCPTVDPETQVSELRSTLEDGDVDGVIVVDDGDPVGTVTPRELVRTHVDDDAQVASFAKAVPTVERSKNVREVARLLVENQASVAPVSQGGEFWGSVSRDGILRAVEEHLDVLTVGDLHTPEVVCIEENDGVGEAINRLRENGISRLPVVDEEGHLTGIVTTTDVVQFVVRDAHAPSAGSRDSGDQELVDLPVSDVMSRPAETTGPDTLVADAVGTMLEEGYDGLVVSPEYTDLVAGVITKTDVLRALTYTESDHMDVQITNVTLLDSISRESVVERIEEVAGKYQDMYVEHAHVRIQKHHEELRNTPLMRCQVRMWTDEDQAAGTGEGYGADEAVSAAIETLEDNVLEMKGRHETDVGDHEELRQEGSNL